MGQTFIRKAFTQRTMLDVGFINVNKEIVWKCMDFIDHNVTILLFILYHVMSYIFTFIYIVKSRNDLLSSSFFYIIYVFCMTLISFVLYNLFCFVYAIHMH